MAENSCLVHVYMYYDLEYRIFNFEKKCLQSLSQQLADDVARFHCTNCGQSSSFNFVESVEQDVSNHMNQDSPDMEQVKIFQN